MNARTVWIYVFSSALFLSCGKDGKASHPTYHTDVDFYLSNQKIEVSKIPGSGGTKWAYQLKDGRVFMYPGFDFSKPNRIGRWEETIVPHEAKTAEFLSEIGVPVLNRVQAELLIRNKRTGKEHLFPVLLSDSFETYANRGWFIEDVKNPNEHSWSRENVEKRGYKFGVFDSETELDSVHRWAKAVSPLLRDLAKLWRHNVDLVGDSSNFAIVKASNKDGINWHIRYFGFDIGGEYGRASHRKIGAGFCQFCREVAKEQIEWFMVYQFLGESPDAKIYRMGVDAAAMEKRGVAYEKAWQILKSLFLCENIVKIIEDEPLKDGSEQKEEL
jgi:hypothetical protein